VHTHKDLSLNPTSEPSPKNGFCHQNHHKKKVAKIIFLKNVGPERLKTIEMDAVQESDDSSCKTSEIYSQNWFLYDNYARKTSL
jgi:hypothetical protein